jgi:hypothetical protein
LIAANTNFDWPLGVRFDFSPLNYLCAGILTLSFPILAIKSFISISSCRIFAILISILCCVISFILMLFIGTNGLFNGSASLELQDSVALGLIKYRIYMDPGGGAYFPPFTVLRKEMDLIPGIKLVRTIWADPHYGNARLYVLSDSMLRIEIDGDFFRSDIDTINGEFVKTNKLGRIYAAVSDVIRITQQRPKSHYGTKKTKLRPP